MNKLSTGICISALVVLNGCAVTETSGSTTVVRIPTPIGQPVATAPVPAAVVGQNGLSIGEVVALIKAQRSDAEIIAAIREQGLRANLSAADLDLLLTNGASREVVDALLQSRTVVAGPIVQPPSSQPSTSTTVIQTVPAPVIVSGVTHGWGWRSSGWHGSAWGGRPWGWGPPRVYHPPVVVHPPVIYPRPVQPVYPVHPVRPPVVISPPVHGGSFGGHGGGNFGRYSPPPGQNHNQGLGNNFRGNSPSTSPGASRPRLSKD